MEDRIDLAIRVSPVDDPDPVVRRVAGTLLVCAGSRLYIEQHGIPKSLAELVDHNCLVDGAMTDWPFAGPKGPVCRFAAICHLTALKRSWLPSALACFIEPRSSVSFGTRMWSRSSTNS